jgi:hypothetical protein
MLLLSATVALLQSVVRKPAEATSYGATSSRRGRLAAPSEEEQVGHDEGVRVVEMRAYGGIELVKFSLVG